MMTTLYLCEKPSQARVLAKALGASQLRDGAIAGNGVIVTWGFGHMRELAPPDHYLGDGKWSISNLPLLPNKWVWQTLPRHQEQYDRIGYWLKKADTVVIATDPDDEGEVLGRQMLVGHRYRGEIKRLWVSALDRDSLTKGLANLLPVSATDSYYRAGMMRRKMDWLLGMNLSRAYSVMLDRTANIGRIKTRLLQMLGERKDAMDVFQPRLTPHYVANIGGMEFIASTFPAGKPTGGVCVSSIDESVDIQPPLPYTLSSLLIDASEKAGIGLADAYAAVQLLYEAGAISYPRTSSHSLPKSGHAGFAAHHAIVPLRDAAPSWFDETGHAIFRLVRTNDVMNYIGPARATRRTTVVDFGGTLFRNITTWVTEDNLAGWMLRDQREYNRFLDKPTVTLAPGQRIKGWPSVVHEPVEPPVPYGEASLLRMMVEKSIGTEATRVEAVTSLTRNGMAVMRDGGFVPTVQGLRLLYALPARVRGGDMEQMVQKAVAGARASADDGGAALVGAAKWLFRQIYADSKVQPTAAPAGIAAQSHAPVPPWEVLTDLSCYA